MVNHQMSFHYVELLKRTSKYINHIPFLDEKMMITSDCAGLRAGITSAVLSTESDCRLTPLSHSLSCVRDVIVFYDDLVVMVVVISDNPDIG